MSRFVRASKYRHVFGQPGKKEYGLENVKVTGSAWDTNVVAASGEYLSINWNASGGGAFAILPLPSPFTPTGFSTSKLPDNLPLARSHTAPVLDTDWSPHNDSIVASGGEDGKVMIWKVEAQSFEGWGAEGWVPTDFDPVSRIDASPRKIGQVLFHPTAPNVLASASGEHTVKLWDLANPEEPRSVLVGHGDAIQSLAFNPTGTVLATTCRDRKLRIFDPRAGGEAVRVGDGHGGIKGSRAVWMGEHDRIATTGFSKMSDRQLAVWETGGLGNIKSIVLDQSAGVIMPFWSDNNILFLAGKGDGNIRYYEYESDALYALSEHKSSDPQRGMCFLPRRALNVSECEIARAYKVAASSIEPIAFIVPRKADSFQSDIFPPAPSTEASLSASEFFAGKTAAQRLVSLETGVSFSSKGAGISAGSPAPPPPKTEPTPSRTYTAPAPEPAPVPSPAPRAEPMYSRQTSVDSFSTPSPAQSFAPVQSRSNTDSALAEENARLTAELREAREIIRNLELQLESVRANARKAAQALLDG
ncbi:microtubule binding protein [Mycena pura]|uniref:Coronin n=1 Tax=Mycena pura TaxID=153505 RepID=A0AAD6YBR2_9AGAR|nr:microtubule binding protein [Mycena pura]